MADFRMPSLGADMEAGTLVEWLVEPGDTVSRGDVVAVVETQKGAIEIDTFHSGTVLELVAKLGQTLPVGEVMARIGTPGEAEPVPKRQAAASLAPEVVEPPLHVRENVPKTPQALPGVRASPAARKAARAAGIDLSTLAGSGPGGAVRLADVQVAKTPAESAGTVMRSEASGMRRAIAAAMVRSKREIPHFYVSHTIETQPVSNWLADRNADLPPARRILLGAVFAKAAALAAKTVDGLNGHYLEDGFRPADHVHIGLAIALRGGGLVAPALEAAETLTLDAVMQGMRDLTTRARAGRLRSSEFTRATFTMSSLGEAGAEAMSGIIFPPQVALLTVGSPRTRPWVTHGTVAPREVTTFGLSADHRACDGRAASRFMIELETRLHDPETI